MATDAASAATQRADSQALSELNERSCEVGHWEVGTFRPAIHQYKWITKTKSSTGKTVNSRMPITPVRYAIACKDRSDGRRRLVVLFSGHLHNGIENFWRDTIERMEADQPLPQFTLPQFKTEFGLQDIQISTYGRILVAPAAIQWPTLWKQLHDSYDNNTPVEISEEEYNDLKNRLENYPASTQTVLKTIQPS